MDELVDKAKSQMDLVEDVVSGVPGIKGYKEKELRRESDYEVRKLLARRLDEQKGRLDGIMVELTNSGQLLVLGDLDRAGKKLQLLTDRIRTASYGYAPLFDSVRVKEAQLDALAEFDDNLFQDVDRVAKIIDNLTTLSGRPDPEWKEASWALSSVLDNMNIAYNRRDEVILQSIDSE
ncbi:MAG: hypothetical protein U9R25_05350 [Chloroflexota bacterium]|nr:hypothetical protein [Chloroflexota bacterium]